MTCFAQVRRVLESINTCLDILPTKDTCILIPMIYGMITAPPVESFPLAGGSNELFRKHSISMGLVVLQKSSSNNNVWIEYAHFNMSFVSFALLFEMTKMISIELLGSNRIEWRYWYGGISIVDFWNGLKKYHGHQMGISLFIFQIIQILLFLVFTSANFNTNACNLRKPIRVT